jgi:hypothetical protein
MSVVVQKVCHGCGIDVSQQKRTKDVHTGRYYCPPCWEDVSRSGRVAAVTPRPLVAAVHAPTPTYQPEEDEPYMAYGAGTPSAESPTTQADVEAVSPKPVARVEQRPGRGKPVLIGGCVLGVLAGGMGLYALSDKSKATAASGERSAAVASEPVTPAGNNGQQSQAEKRAAPAAASGEHTDALGRERKAFLDGVAPFVKVAKNLRGRAGTDFQPSMELVAFAEKVGNLEDAYTEIGTPPKGQEFTGVAETAKLVLANYKTCLEARELSASGHRSHDPSVWVEAEGTERRSRRQADQNVGLLMKALDLANTAE